VKGREGDPAKLPKWAQEKITRLEGFLYAAQEAYNKLADTMAGKGETRIFADLATYGRDPLDVRHLSPLPSERVVVSLGTPISPIGEQIVTMNVNVPQGGEPELVIHTSGALYFQPQYGNGMRIVSARRF